MVEMEADTPAAASSDDAPRSAPGGSADAPVEAEGSAPAPLLQPTDAYVQVVADDTVDTAAWTRRLGRPVRTKASQAAHFAPTLSDSQRGNLTMHEMRARGMLVEQHIDSLGPDIVARLLEDVHDARRCRALVGSFKAGVARTVYALMVADRTNWSAVTAQRPLGTKRAGTSLPPYHAMDGSLSFLTHNPTSCLLFESSV
jgi:hypothetical protein